MRNVRKKRRGFTLLELLVVVTIIGIIVALITAAATDGIRRAEERQTQALIVKLEQAVSDRMAALMLTTAPINRAHQWLAAIQNTNVPGTVIPSPERAQIIARIDMIRSELPELWFPLSNSVVGNKQGAQAEYIVSYGGNSYPTGVKTPTADNFTLPLGCRVDPHLGGADAAPSDGGAIILPNVNRLDGSSGYQLDPNFDADGTGILGASYGAAAGIAKNLGALPNGFDGVDNNGDSYTDEFAEWWGTDLTVKATILAHIANHNPKTARSEMLYALLVEGQGALGSLFTRDSFTDREVKDTDGDGLPEFIDAWGEPLQFFRWPIYYIDSDLSPVDPIIGAGLNNPSLFQRGFLPYASGAFDLRQQNPLDPSQLLVGPAWWGNLVNSLGFYGGTANSIGCSSSAMEFQFQFFSLTDPNFAAGAGTAAWDRSGQTARRAYFSKFLIISSGPDKTLGIDLRLPAGMFDATHLNLITNQAAQASIFQDGTNAPTTILNRSVTPLFESIVNLPSSGYSINLSSPLYVPDSSIFWTASVDDISNHNLSGPGSGVR